MSYTDWRDWALGVGADCPDDNQETWRRVAENADSDAHYENPDTHPEAYRNDLGEQHPTTEKQFNEVCQDLGHQLTGAPIEGAVPNLLARCVKRRSLKTQVNQRFETEKRGGRNYRRTPSEDHEFELSNIPSGGAHAGEVLPDPMDEDLYLSRPDANRVFATPGIREQHGDAGASITFYEHLQYVQRHNYSLAQEAVYRLALSRSVDSPQKRLLLLYKADPFETFRYPVPPDAEFWSLFRPVEEGEDHEFGRTCPGGHPCDEKRDEPELVHNNLPIPADLVWIFPL